MNTWPDSVQWTSLPTSHAIAAKIACPTWIVKGPSTASTQILHRSLCTHTHWEAHTHPTRACFAIAYCNFCWQYRNCCMGWAWVAWRPAACNERSCKEHLAWSAMPLPTFSRSSDFTHYTMSDLLHFLPEGLYKLRKASKGFERHCLMRSY